MNQASDIPSGAVVYNLGHSKLFILIFVILRKKKIEMVFAKNFARFYDKKNSCKGPSINDVSQFSRIYDPPPSPCRLRLLNRLMWYIGFEEMLFMDGPLEVVHKLRLQEEGVGSPKMVTFCQHS